MTRRAPTPTDPIPPVPDRVSPTPVVLDSSWACTSCVRDPFLETRATTVAPGRPCIGCRRLRTKGFNLAFLADEVHAVMNVFFKRAPEEPDSVDAWIAMQETGVYEPPGHPLGAIVEALVGCKAVVAAAICDLLHEREGGHHLIQDGGEPQFLWDCLYVGNKLSTDLTQYFAFQRLEHRLRFQARYFHPESRALLASVFKDVHGLITQDGRAIAVAVTPGSAYSQLYRARVFQSDEPLRQALIAPDRELGPPPAAIAVAGRMNAAHISLFYGATAPGTALAEVRPPAHSCVLIGRFDVQRPLKLLDVAALQSVLVHGSPFDPIHRQRVRNAEFLSFVGHRMSRPILPDHQTGEYLITQAIADYLAYECIPPFDGMLYPSTQSDEGVNVVLFHDASRVARWCIPDTSVVEADLTRSTEDGPEPDYEVVEWVNDPRASARNGDGAYDGDDEQRAITLHLDKESLEVRHAERVTYTTITYKVKQQVIDRTEPSEF